MAVQRRLFDKDKDVEAIYDFLVSLYKPNNRGGNWFGAIWEYGYTHDCFDTSAEGCIGIWEDDGKIVGVATYELLLGEAFLHVHPDYASLKPEMLEHSEQNFTAMSKRVGKTYLQTFVNEFDTEHERFVESRGYVRRPEGDRHMSQLPLSSPMPTNVVPEGFRLQPLSEDNDWQKIVNVWHRGFDHEGPPPTIDASKPWRMQTGSHFRPDLTVVAVGPDDEFVSYAGLWYDEVNKFAFVEPVCTHPDYRRRHLASAAVLEGVRRCQLAGAMVAYVEAIRPVYLYCGFRQIYTSNCWIKYFS